MGRADIVSMKWNASFIQILILAQSCSLSRANSFNDQNVSARFTNLENISSLKSIKVLKQAGSLEGDWTLGTQSFKKILYHKTIIKNN